MDGFYRRYLDAIAVPDQERAIEVLDEALTEGVPTADVITAVLGRAQRTVGERWMRGEWSIADEYAATAVTKQALALVSPPDLAHRTGPHVVVACAEGEWHSLAARMAGELLRADDELEVTVLGAGTSVGQLADFLQTTTPEVLALSATVTTSLVGAADSIRAARGAGVPVVVGGSAWGGGRQRARSLGAHERLVDIRDLQGRLDEIRAMRLPPMPGIPAEARWLHDVPGEVLDAAVSATGTEDDAQAGHLRRDVRRTAQHAAAAVACDDPAVVTDYLDWALGFRRARHLQAAPLLDAALCLADVVGEQAPRAAAVLRQEVGALTR